jgi:DNA-binding NarL/FixJ family response regulator
MNSAPKPIRVLLADDHTLVRAGIRALLEKLPDVTVVGEAADGHEVVNLVGSTAPHVVLMDISMSGLDGFQATERIVAEYPDVRVLMLSMHSEEEFCWQSLKVGASGYLLKKSATAELDAALNKVVSGETYISTEISSQPLNRFSLHGLVEKSPLEQLTSRQREVLQMIAEGQNTKQIAGILNISPKTVEYHRTKLMEALNVHDVPGLVRFAMRSGLVSQEA